MKELIFSTIISNDSSSFFVGIDPTASSMHLGHLSILIGASYFAAAGYNPIFLLGSATAHIGDPSFRNTEKKSMLSTSIAFNAEKLEIQLKTVFNNICVLKGIDVNLMILNNHSWHSQYKLLDFIHEFGGAFKIQTMLQKECMKSRLDTENGLNLREFLYQVFQAYDFYHLYTLFNCSIQIGGSDQWGNIIAGSDLIKKFHKEAKPFALTLPLLTKSNGEKFGKSSSDVVWLDKTMTSPLELYQVL